MKWPQLPARAEISLDELRQSVGQTTTSVWVEIDREMIEGFAAVTGDDSFIHLDPERARQTRFGGTVAHGLLVLSLQMWLMRSAVPGVRGAARGVNYGYENVRFLQPVPTGSRVRGHFTLAEVMDRGPGFILTRYDVSVEIEGMEKPALVYAALLGKWLD
jgi:acyl dehydratase